MQKSVLPWLTGVLIISLLFTHGGNCICSSLNFPRRNKQGLFTISIAAGGMSALNVTIFNPNAFQLTNASWTDNLIGVQPGLVIANPVGLTDSCGGSVTAVAGSTSLSLSGGTVPAQVWVTPGSCTVSINVTSTTLGNLINTIPANALSSTGAGANVTNTTPASATLNVTGTLPPSVNKSFSPSTIWAGQTSQLSIVIRNYELSRNLTQVSLTDNLPTNLFLANPVFPSLTGCGASASLTAVSGGTSVTLNNGTISANSTCTITVNVTSNTQGAYTNSIPANSLQTQEGPTNSTTTSAVKRSGDRGCENIYTFHFFSRRNDDVHHHTAKSEEYSLYRCKRYRYFACSFDCCQRGDEYVRRDSIYRQQTVSVWRVARSLPEPNGAWNLYDLRSGDCSAGTLAGR